MGNAEVDIEAKAQKIADAMVAKKMKGMPTKEELKAFKDWQESQKTADRVFRLICFPHLSYR